MLRAEVRLPRGAANRGPGGRTERGGSGRGAPHKLMGAGVATNPHCPGSDCQAPKGQTLVAGRFGFPAEAFLLRRVPFRGTFARRLQSHWTPKKLGSAFASHFFFGALPVALATVTPRGDCRLRGGNVRKL